MAEKKNHGRFCVQFNLSDPRHRQTVEILEQQGRRKAQFIVDMVLGTAITDIASLQPLVEPIVKQLLARQPAATATAGADDDLKSAIQGVMAAWGPG